MTAAAPRFEALGLFGAVTKAYGSSAGGGGSGCFLKTFFVRSKAARIRPDFEEFMAKIVSRPVPADTHSTPPTSRIQTSAFVGYRKMTIFITFVTMIVTWPFYTNPAMPVPQQAAQSQKAQAEGVQITYGPVVESVTDTTAIIAWSTNVNAGTLLRYGSDPKHLDHTAGMPWGGLTHR